MPKAAQRWSAVADQPRAGIFGPEWPKWRGAIMRIALDDEPPFMAQLVEVWRVPRPNGHRAAVTELDEQFRPLQMRTLPWPPNGQVRVLRTP